MSPASPRTSDGTGTGSKPTAHSFSAPAEAGRLAPGTLGFALLLTGLTAFGPLSTDLYLPALPSIVGALDTTVSSAQLTLSVFLAGIGVAQLVCGPLSDRFGRRPVLLGGLALYAVASLVCLLATSIEQLILARFFQALGACCGPVLGRAIVRDVYPPEQAPRMYAALAMATALAPAIAPIVGGYLTEAAGWRASFVVLAALGFVMLAVVAAVLGESNRYLDPHAVSPRGLFRNYRQLFGHRAYLGYVAAASGIFSGLFAFISSSSFLLIDRFGLNPLGYGLSFAAIVVGFVIGAFLAGRLTGRIGLDRVISLGMLIGLAGGLLGLGLALSGTVTLATVIGPVALFMVGTGLTLPTSLAGAVGPFPHMAGLASALLGFIQLAVASLTGLLVGVYHDGTALPMMVAIILVVSVGGLLFRRLVSHAPQG